MITQQTIMDLLTGQLANAATQWSLGTFGAVAEFSRDATEPVQLTTTETEIAAVTDRGSIAIRFVDGVRLFASESVTRDGWNHRVALCLPENDCAMGQRNMLTELGSDADARRDKDRNGVLFDLGLGALHADFCIRIHEGTITEQLREHLGRSLFEPGNPAMGIILSVNPHRVFISRVGRIEVYQQIPPATGRSPDGPHTHVLPKLLKSCRTHAATEPVPEGWVPCANFYPAHPTKDACGSTCLFDRPRHEDFQRLLDCLGDPESNAIKGRVIAAIENERPPSVMEIAINRASRNTVRVTLRQLKALGHPSRTLPAWLEAFDVGRSKIEQEAT
jgi:hypothetical protein